MAYSTADAAILERDYQDGKVRKTMPYESKAQQRWAHTPTGLAALGGMARVHEWDEATKTSPSGFDGLPERKTPRRRRKRPIGPPRRPSGQTSGPGK